MKFYTKQPSNCTKDEIESFMALVIQANEVDPDGLEGRVRRAEKLIFMIEDNGVLMGVAALKRPHNNYKISVFKKAKSKEDPASYPFEIGWIVIDEQYRGRKLSRSLMAEVLRIAEGHKVFATTRSNNSPMDKTNKRYGLFPTGVAYPTSREGRDYNLMLYLRNGYKTEPGH